MSEVDRDIGRLEGKVDSMGEQLATVHIKLDKMLSGECVTGKANKHEIVKLDTRVKKVEFTLAKSVGIGIAVAGGATGLGRLLEGLMK